MAKYIDVEKLQLEPDFWGGMNGVLILGRSAGKTIRLVQVALRKMIDNAPAVDAVEVVRCKDCKHYMTIHCTCDGCCISDDWYCADGERRTDERKID